METPIKQYGVDGKSMLICNCTASQDGKNTGVWIESDDPSERQTRLGTRAAGGPVGSSNPRFPHYLPSGSCGTAGSSTVALKPADKTVETWGTFDTFEAK